MHARQPRCVYPVDRRQRLLPLEQPPVILRAELLQNIPVEGVELEPYVLVQYANGQSRQVLPFPSRVDSIAFAVVNAPDDDADGCCCCRFSTVDSFTFNFVLLR